MKLQHSLDITGRAVASELLEVPHTPMDYTPAVGLHAWIHLDLS